MLSRNPDAKCMREGSKREGERKGEGVRKEGEGRKVGEEGWREKREHPGSM